MQQSMQEGATIELGLQQSAMCAGRVCSRMHKRQHNKNFRQQRAADKRQIRQWQKPKVCTNTKCKNVVQGTKRKSMSYIEGEAFMS